MEKPLNEWIHNGIMHDLDCWRLLLPGERGLFLSMSKLDGLCTMKYSRTTEEGEWHSTVKSEEYYCMQLTESGFTPENAVVAQEIGLMLVSKWVRHMQTVYASIEERLTVAGNNTSARTVSSGWYAPYRHGTDPSAYAKKELPDGTTAILKRKENGTSWELSVIMRNLPIMSVHIEGPATLEETKSRADDLIARRLHEPEWMKRCRDCAALVKTPDCPYFCDEAQAPCPEVKNCGEWGT